MGRRLLKAVRHWCRWWRAKSRLFIEVFKGWYDSRLGCSTCDGKNFIRRTTDIDSKSFQFSQELSLIHD